MNFIKLLGLPFQPRPALRRLAPVVSKIDRQMKSTCRPMSEFLSHRTAAAEPAGAGGLSGEWVSIYFH